VALPPTPLMASSLDVVRPAYPLTFACVSALLIAIALAAFYISTCRATKIDPIVALRLEYPSQVFQELGCAEDIPSLAHN